MKTTDIDDERRDEAGKWIKAAPMNCRMTSTFFCVSSKPRLSKSSKTATNTAPAASRTPSSYSFPSVAGTRTNGSTPI